MGLVVCERVICGFVKGAAGVCVMYLTRGLGVGVLRMGGVKKSVYGGVGVGI
jgi:hypothetical protein